jgi:hypothetical protein
VVILNGAGSTVRVRDCVAESGPSFVLDESVIFTLKVEGPAAVSVPEIVPALLNDRPAGNDEPVATLQVSLPAPSVAWRVVL